VPAVGRLRYLQALPRGTVRARGALVLLHPFPLNARAWEPQLMLADHGWHVIAPQFRGFDGGDHDPPATTLDDFAGDICDLLDALHVHEAVIGGLSMGGYVALSIVRHAPRYVQGLILADTRAEADTPAGIEGRKRMLTLVREKGPSAVADEMIPKLLGKTTLTTRPDTVARVRSLVLSNPADAIAGAVTALMTRPDSTPLLATIHRPTLILVGAEDALTPPELSETLQRGISGSDLTVIPRAGHLSSIEQPDAFNDALARFLDHRV
jgi:pimeloyl-ACP methyl ester carboxylesterase